MRSSFRELNDHVPSSACLGETSRYAESEVQGVLNESNKSNVESSIQSRFTTRLALKCVAYLGVPAIKDDGKTTKDRSDSVEARSDQEFEAGDALCILKNNDNHGGRQPQPLPSEEKPQFLNSQRIGVCSNPIDDKITTNPINNIIRR